MSDEALGELRNAFGELLGAERRLRGRNPARKGELSNAQVRALFQLKHGEECTSGELAKRADLSPASVTVMLDQLENDGIVARRRSEQDRRQVIVSLTDAGHAALDAKRAHGSSAGSTSSARTRPTRSRPPRASCARSRAMLGRGGGSPRQRWGFPPSAIGLTLVRL